MSEFVSVNESERGLSPEKIERVSKIIGHLSSTSTFVKFLMKYDVFGFFLIVCLLGFNICEVYKLIFPKTFDGSSILFSWLFFVKERAFF